MKLAVVKKTVWILHCVVFLVSCNSYDAKGDIEALLEIKLPDCYIEIEHPEKENSAAIEVAEYHFSEACLADFLNDIADQSPTAYCGTTIAMEITMGFCTRDESARMTLNTETGVLHYEKLK